MTRFCRKLPMLAAASIITIAYTFAADTSLIEPHSLIVDRSLPILEYRGRSSSTRRPCAELCRQYAPDWTPPGSCGTAGSLKADARGDPRPQL